MYFNISGIYMFSSHNFAILLVLANVAALLIYVSSFSSMRFFCLHEKE